MLISNYGWIVNFKFLSIYSVPEPMVKRIVYQVLLAVNFCHQHHVSMHYVR